jgi:drug/metabolite transporter (DMT)-like permease
LNSGFALGAAAALAWGFADVIVTFYARRIGYLRALVVIHGLSLVPLALLALVVEPPEPVTTGSLVSAAALGPVAVVAYMGFYKALELGPISIVSPIVSAFGAVVVLLALLVLGDSLTAVQAFGCGLVLSCVIVASIETSGTDRAGATGIALSLVACLAFGLYLFLQGELADELGWLLPILVSRVVAVLMLGALLAAMPGDEPRDKLGLAGVAGCAATGALEASAYLFFNRGAEIGEIALTGAAVSAYPVIPILVGLFALHERVARHQLVGVAGVLAGMVVLALG